MVAHVRPVVEIDDGFDDDQKLPPALRRHGRELGGEGLLGHGACRRARLRDVLAQRRGLVLVNVHGAPERHDALAELGMGPDVGAQPCLSVTGKGARGSRTGVREQVIGGGDSQRGHVMETLEHRPYRATGAIGDLVGRRILAARSQQRQVGLDDALARPFGAKEPAIDLCWRGAGVLRPARRVRHR